MVTLPNLFSTTMALPASDPSGSSSATLADASTVFPSFFLPLGHFAFEMRAANSDRGDGYGDSHVFPLLARNEPAHESKRPLEDPGLKGLLILLSVIDRRLGPGPPAHRRDGRARSGYHWPMTRRSQ